MRKLFLLLSILIANFSGKAQITLISGTGVGGFESGTTLAANGWTAVNNSSTDGWVVGTTPAGYSGSRCAYYTINGTNNNYANSFSTVHLYRDVYIPVGATSINLTWSLKGNGENGWDRLLVYYGTPSTILTAGTPAASSTTLTGATLIYTQTNFYSSFTGQSATIPNSKAGSTVRLIFTWQNDDGTRSNPAAAIDNVNLTYVAGAACSGTPTAGTISGATTTCPGSPAYVSLSGFTNATGIGFQWQSSPDNASWTDISGATNSDLSPTPLTTTYYRANVSCLAGTPVSSGSSQVSMIPCTLIMPSNGSTATATICDAYLYDPGGPSGSYLDGQNGFYTIYPTIPGAKISVTFTSFNTESGYDYVRIFDGHDNTFSPVPGSPFSGSSLPPSYTSTAADGALTFRFNSDGSNTSSGFAATLSNANVPNSITTQPAATTNACQGVAATISVGTTASNTYRWYDNGTTNSNTGGTPTAVTTNTFSPSTSTVGTKYYYCVVTNQCGTNYTSNVAAVVVSPLPAGLTGTPNVCEGGTTTLSSTTPGGVWTSSAATATVTGGTVTGVTAGTATISYSISQCRATTVVTVKASPAVITGTFSACVNATTTLNSTPGNTWSSGSTSIATVASNGVVTGVDAGLATISYTAANGCARTAVVSINPLPVLNITPGTLANVCIGSGSSFTADVPTAYFSLLSQNFNSGPGTWAINNISGPPSGFWQAVTPAASVGGIPGDGTQMMQAAGFGSAVNTQLTSPSFSTVGYGSAFLYFNQYLLSDGTDASIIVEYSTNGGGAWNLLNDETQSGIVGDGSWSPTANVTIVPLPPAAVNAPDVKLRWSYNGSSFYWYIDNVSVKAALPAPSYSWTGVSGATGLSCTTCTTPTITPTAVGNNIYSVTATSNAGCATTSGVTVSVNPYPGAITGINPLCVGSFITLSDPLAGGTWSSGDAAVNVVSGTGKVTGMAIGTATITYTSAQGCSVTATLAVIPASGNITGTPSVCAGLTTSLTHGISGGTWSSSADPIASVGTSGIVTGNSAGSATITYTLPSGCFVTAPVTVNPLPNAITGTASVCEQATTQLSSTSPSGTWTSDAPTTASVNTSGLVTGVLAGNANITYTLSTGCITTKAVTVNTTPFASTGAQQVCIGMQTTLSNTPPSGTWSSGATGIASVNTAGQVSGISVGNAPISFTLTNGCYTVAVVTVNALPGAINGNVPVCEGASTTLTDADLNGVWASSAPGVASVGTAGLLTGIAAGNSTITYTLPTGCYATAEATVNMVPADISGNNTVCEGLTETLSNSTANGTWASNAGTIASVDAGGLVTGASAGSATISYTLTNGCYKTIDMTVNAAPTAINGNPEVCIGATTALSNTDMSGTWNSSAPGIASVSAAGLVSGTFTGTSNITYTLPGGCIRSITVTVNPLPAGIAGSAVVCGGATTTLTNTTANGVWSTSDNTVADISAAGTVTGMNPGTATIAYTLLTGCARTKVVTVNAAPGPIGGITEVCAGAATTLSNSVPGGNWSSSNFSVASVNSMGNVTGSAAGTANITYSLTSGCRQSITVTVDPLPNNITGSAGVCINEVIVLSSTTANGMWSSNNAVVADVDASGNVTGFTTGSATISYTLPAGGCYRTKTITVNPLPANITGTFGVCIGLTTQLSNTTASGNWSSSNTAAATINTSGLVTSAGTGNTIISYTLPTGCRTTAEVTVNPLPANIGGTARLCKDATTTLTNTDLNGNWNSDNTGVAMIDAGGTVTGMSAGNAIITYTLPTGCVKTRTVTVDPLPAAITGNGSVCIGATTALASATAGGTWNSNDAATASVSSTGMVVGMAAGFTFITYTLPTGCTAVTPFTVNNVPDDITGTTTICDGSTTTLSNNTGGGVWSSLTGIVSINSSGLMTGIAAGSTTVSYGISNGCVKTTTVTVNPLPANLIGPSEVCEQATIALSNASASGAWSSSDITIADVNTTSGAVSGMATGSAVITYTLPTACYKTKTVTVNQGVAAITGVSSICPGTTASLGTTSTGGLWLSGNTAAATVDINTGVVTSIASGTSPISYIVPTGCYAIGVMTVNPLPANIAGASAICEQSATTLSNASAGGSWISSDATIADIGSATGVVTGMAAGSAAITYTLPTGCFKTTSIIVNALPAVNDLSGGGSYCDGGSGRHINLDGSVNGITYKLYNEGILVSTYTGTGSSMDLGAFTAAGNYSATATAATGCLSDMPGSASITIMPLITPSIVLTSTTPATLCSGRSVTYTAAATNSGTTPAYSWNVNGGTPTSAATSYTYTPANGDIVTATVTSSEACPSVASVSASETMSVIPSLTPSVNISVSPNSTICKNTMVEFSAAPVNGGTAPTYTWMSGTTTIGTGASITHVPANNEQIIAKLNSNYDCPTTNNVSSNAILMHVDDAFIPMVTILVDPGTVIKAGTEAKFSTVVTGAGPSATYQWLINGVAISGATNTTFTTSTLADRDSVTCVVRGSGACALTSINSVYMTVQPATGVAHTALSAADIKLLPNPNSGTFTVKGTLGVTTDEEVSLQVTNILGQTVYSGKTMARNGNIDQRIQLGNELANGMYMLNVRSGMEHITFHFVLKQ